MPSPASCTSEMKMSETPQFDPGLEQDFKFEMTKIIEVNIESDEDVTYKESER